MELQKATDGVDAGLKTIAEIVDMADETETERVKAEFDPEKRSAVDLYRMRLAKKMKTESE